VLVTQFCYVPRDAAIDTVSNKDYAFLGRRVWIKDHADTSLTRRELAGMLGRSTYAGGATNSASLAATFAIVFSAVFSPFRDASMGLTSRRASYVVLCTTGMS
jgi:hypothetical protein